MKIVDVAVVGGGIVGLATARALAREGRSVVVLEAEERVATHQTGHNSGVIHSGLYYRPDSEKARTSTAGRRALYRYLEERGIAHERCGKLVVALGPEELPRLDELERRGRANGIAGLVRLAAGELARYEPHVAGIAGLWVPETGIVDYRQVARAFAEDITAAGGEVKTGARLLAVAPDGTSDRLATAAGEVACRLLVNCAGLECDRVARLAGLDPGVRIVPFRGDYYDLVPERRGLVRNLIYPVPDPALPFLGVHFTRRISGEIEAGPNAVLAWKRAGYHRASFSFADAASTLTFPGFWRMAPHYLGVGLAELRRAWSRRAFVAELRRLLPEIRDADVAPAGCGVRAQAVDRQGRLLDDFAIVETPRGVHVLNAPSPGATASLAIGETIAQRARARLDA
jgi:L-2-hydroxyglutarate oxidase